MVSAPITVVPLGDEISFTDHAASIDAEGSLIAIGAPGYDLDTDAARSDSLVRDRYTGALTSNLREAGINIAVSVGDTLYSGTLDGSLFDSPRKVAGGFVLGAAIDVGLAFAFTSLESEFFDVGAPNVDYNDVGAIYRFVVAENRTFFQGIWNAWPDALAMGNLRSRDLPYINQPNRYELGTKVRLQGGRLTASAPGWATNTFKGQRTGPDYVGLLLLAGTNIPHPVVSTAFKIGSWVHESSKKALERDYNSPHHHGSLMSFGGMSNQRSSESDVVNFTSGSQAQWLGQAFAIDGNRAIASASAWRFVNGRDKGAGPPTRGHAGFHRFNFVDGRWQYADTPWDFLSYSSIAQAEANTSYIADSVREVEIVDDSVFFIATGATAGRGQSLYMLPDRMVANHEVPPTVRYTFSSIGAVNQPALRVGGGKAGVPKYLVAAVPDANAGNGGAYVFDASGSLTQVLLPAGGSKYGVGLAVLNDLIAVSQSDGTRNQIYLYRYQGSLSNWVLERTITMADLGMSGVQKFGDHLAMTPEYIAIVSQLDSTQGSLRTAALGRRLEAVITFDKYDFGLVPNPQLLLDLESTYTLEPPAAFANQSNTYGLRGAAGEFIRVPLTRFMGENGAITAAVSFNYRSTYKRDVGPNFAFGHKVPPEPAFRLRYKVLISSGQVVDVFSDWVVPAGTPRGDHSPENTISNKAYAGAVTTVGLPGSVVEAFVEFRLNSGTQSTANNFVPKDSDSMDSLRVVFPSSAAPFTLNSNGEQIDFAMEAGLYQLLLADGGRALTGAINLVDRFVDARSISAVGPYAASGRLTAPDWGGAGVSGIEVKARSAGGHELTATTDADGRYTLSGLWPGMTYTFEPQVIAEVQRSPAAITRTVQASNGDETAIDFALSSNLTLHVQTGSSSGRALSPVSIRLTAPHLGGAELTGISDAGGNVHFIGLLPGSHALSAGAYRWPLSDANSLVVQFEANVVTLNVSSNSLNHQFVLRTGELDFQPTDLNGPSPVDGALFGISRSNTNTISGYGAAEKVPQRVPYRVDYTGSLVGNYSESKIWLPAGRYPGDFTLTVHANALPTEFPLKSGAFPGSSADWLNYVVEVTRPDGVSWSGKLFEDAGAVSRFSPNGRLIDFRIDGDSSVINGVEVREEHWQIRLPEEIRPSDEFEAGVWTVAIRNPQAAIKTEMVDASGWGLFLPVSEYLADAVNPTGMTLELETDVLAVGGSRLRLNEADRLPSGNFELPLDFTYTLLEAPSKYIISSPVSTFVLDQATVTSLAPEFRRQNEIELKLLPGPDWGPNPFPADDYIERSDGRWGYATVFDVNHFYFDLTKAGSGGASLRSRSVRSGGSLVGDRVAFDQVSSGDYGLAIAANALGSGVYGGTDYSIDFDTSQLTGVSGDLVGDNAVEVTMNPTGLVEVNVVDADGTPIEGVSLQFVPNPDENGRLAQLLPGLLVDPVVVTDANGEARHANLFPRSYVLTGAKPDYRLEPLVVAIGGSDLPASVTLTAYPLRAEGTALDFNGDPLANADLIFRDPGHDDVTATTDANGDFVIEGMPGGFFDVYLVTPGAGSTLLESGVEFHGNAINRFDLELESLSVRGRLVSEDPNFVYANLSGSLLDGVAVIGTFTTDSTGRFAVDGLFPGSYVLEVANGDLGLSSPIHLAEDTDLGDTILAARQVQLSGRLLEADTGAAMQGATIRASSEADQVPAVFSQRTIAAPRLTLRQPGVETITFDFGASGTDRVSGVSGSITVRSRDWLFINAAEDNTTPFTFDLISPDGRSVSGDLVAPAIVDGRSEVYVLNLGDLDLSAFTGATLGGVWQINISTSPFPFRVDRIDAVLTLERDEQSRLSIATTDANGQWTLTIPSGAIELLAQQSGWGFTPFKRAVTTTVDQGNLDFSGIVSRVAGSLTLRGSGLGGIAVELTGPNDYRETVISDADGSYTFGGVPAGLYQITLNPPVPHLQFANASFPVDVDALVVAAPTQEAITSELTLSFNTPFAAVAGVAVQLIGPETLTGVSDSNGQLVFPAVLPGNYRTVAIVAKHRVNIASQISVGQGDLLLAVACDRLSDVTVPVNFADGFGGNLGLSLLPFDGGVFSTVDPVAFTSADENGVGVFTALDDGRYYLRFDRGYQVDSASYDFTVNNGDITINQVEARAWKDLVVEVTHRGRPVPGVSVDLRQRDIPGRAVELTATTDAQGRVVLPAAPPDLYDYEITHPYISTLSGILTHTIEGPAISFAATGLAEVSGTVTRRDRNGRPAGGVVVEIDGISATTDAEGNYTISGLLDGARPLSVEREGYVAINVPSEIMIDGYQTSRSFEVEGLLGFSAIFVDAGGEPLADVDIAVKEDSLNHQSTRTLQTNSAGALILTDIGPDDYLYLDLAQAGDLPAGQFLLGAGERYVPARGEVGADFVLTPYSVGALAITQARSGTVELSSIPAIMADTGELTVEFWTRLTGNQAALFYASGDDLTAGFYSVSKEGSALRFPQNNNTSQTDGVFPSTTTWYHVAITYHSSDATGDATMYLNGQVVAFPQFRTAFEAAGPVDFFVGGPGSIIDEVRVWNRALKASEIFSQSTAFDLPAELQSDALVEYIPIDGALANRPYLTGLRTPSQTALDIAVPLANGSGLTPVLTAESRPLEGTVERISSDTLRFTPAADFIGQATITYTLENEFGLTTAPTNFNVSVVGMLGALNGEGMNETGTELTIGTSRETRLSMLLDERWFGSSDGQLRIYSDINGLVVPGSVVIRPGQSALSIPFAFPALRRTPTVGTIELELGAQRQSIAVRLEQTIWEAFIRVVDPAGAPVEGVSVVLTGGMAPITRQSDVEGAVTFANLAEGLYSVELSAPGYDLNQGDRYSYRFSPAQPPVSHFENITFAANRPDFSRTFVARPYSQVAGTLTGIDPSKLDTVVVAIENVVTGDGATLGRIAADGYFGFQGLAPGDYRVSLTADGYTIHPSSLVVTAGPMPLDALAVAATATVTNPPTFTMVANPALDRISGPPRTYGFSHYEVIPLTVDAFLTHADVAGIAEGLGARLGIFKSPEEQAVAYGAISAQEGVVYVGATFSATTSSWNWGDQTPVGAIEWKDGFFSADSSFDGAFVFPDSEWGHVPNSTDILFGGGIGGFLVEWPLASDATIHLGGPVNADTQIQLSSSHPDLISVPNRIVVDAGQSSVTFQMHGRPVASETIVTITATVGGSSAEYTFSHNPPAIISGRVENAQGEAIAGALIQARDASGVFVYSARSGADGSYSMQHARRHYELTVSAALPGFTFAASETDSERDAAQANGTFITQTNRSETGMIPVDQAGLNFVGTSFLAVTGTVEVETQAGVRFPAAGVNVSVGAHSATTASDGSYVVSGLLRGSYAVSADMDGVVWAPASQMVEIDAESQTVDFVGTGALEISGQLAGTDGSPLSGQTVILLRENAGQRSPVDSQVTDGSGQYRFTGLLPNQILRGTYQIQIDQPNVDIPDSIRAQIGRISLGSSNVTLPAITLSARTIEGHILQPDGSPVAGISVTAEGATFNGTPVSLSSVTGADGSYVISGVPHGVTLSVVPAASGYAFAPIRQAVDWSDMDQALFQTGVARVIRDFTLATGLSGQIVDAGGSGVPDATLTLSGTTTEGASRSMVSQTDSTGFYNFDVEPGNYTILPSAGASTFTPADREVVLTGALATNIDFQISGWTGVEGRVTRLGQPLSGITVTATNRANPIQGFLFFSGETYDPVNMTSGVTYTQSSAHSGDMSALAITVLLRVNTEDANLPVTADLTAPSGAVYRVFDQATGLFSAFLSGGQGSLRFAANQTNNAALAQAIEESVQGPWTLRVQTGANVPTYIGSFSMSYTVEPTLTVLGSTTTGADGSYRMPLPIDSYFMQASASGLAVNEINPTVVVGAGNLAQQDFTMSRAMTIEGVVERDGAPLGGVSVALAGTIIDGSALPARTATSDANGVYRFEALEAGSYTVSVSAGKTYFSESVQNVDLVNADVAMSPILGAETFSISGRVDKAQVRWPNLPVVAQPGNYTATTDFNGNYVLDNLPPGTYTVTPSGATANNLYPRVHTVNLSGGDATGVDFAQPKADTLAVTTHLAFTGEADSSYLILSGIVGTGSRDTPAAPPPAMALGASIYYTPAAERVPLFFYTSANPDSPTPSTGDYFAFELNRANGQVFFRQGTITLQATGNPQIYEDINTVVMTLSPYEWQRIKVQGDGTRVNIGQATEMMDLFFSKGDAQTATLRRSFPFPLNYTRGMFGYSPLRSEVFSGRIDDVFIDTTGFFAGEYLPLAESYLDFEAVDELDIPDASDVVDRPARLSGFKGVTVASGDSVTAELSVAQAGIDLQLGAQRFDDNPVTFEIVQAPQGGALFDLDSATGAVTYRYVKASAGSDLFSFRVVDSLGRASRAREISLDIIANRIEPVVTWDTPEDMVFGTALSGAQLSASTSVPARFTYSPAAGIVLPVGTHTLAVRVVPEDNRVFMPTVFEQVVTVTQQAPVITWNPSPTVDFGDRFNQAWTAPTAAVAGTFSSSFDWSQEYLAGNYTVDLEFTPDSGNYSAPLINHSLEILPSVGRIPDWLSSYGLDSSAAVASADFSGDGVPALGARVMGLSPLERLRAEDKPGWFRASSGEWVFRFKEEQRSGYVTGVIEYTTDFVTWRRDLVTYTIESSESNYDWKIATISGLQLDAGAPIVARLIYEYRDLNDLPETFLLSPSDGATYVVGDTIVFTATATDADGDTELTIEWEIVDSSATVVGSGVGESYSVTGLEAGNYTARATAVDSFGGRDPDPAEISFTVGVNQPPETIITSPSAGASMSESGSLVFTASATDPEGNLPLTFAWSILDGNGAVVRTGTGQSYSVSGLSAGIYTAQVVASDALGATDPTPAERVFSVTANAVPTLSFTAPTTGDTFAAAVGQTVNFTVVAADADGPAPTVSWYLGAGSTSVLGTGTSFSRTFTSAGTYVVRARAVDNLGAFTEKQITVTATVNQPSIVITAPANNARFQEFDSITLTAQIFNAPNGTVTWEEPVNGFFDTGLETTMIASSAGFVTITATLTYNGQTYTDTIDIEIEFDYGGGGPGGGDPGGGDPYGGGGDPYGGGY